MSLAGDKIRLWRERPDIFVREVFKATPDPWQDEILKVFPTNQRIVMKASKGPGKSTVLAWLAWNFLLTRPHPKIAATSISADNLRDGLWAEMAKWRDKAPIIKETFLWQKERIFAKDHPETWWCAARSWSKAADPSTLGNTLAGLHADYILFILDESGGMPEAIMASAEAALSSCVEGHIIQAGNPTHLEGPLYRACTSDRSMWHVAEITSDPDSPLRSPRVSVEWAKEQILKYGRDNPWVLVNVFGQFPPSSFNALIGPDEIQAAVNRRYREVDFDRSARILGIDVARYGADSSIIFPRQGLQAFDPLQYRNIDGNQGAEVTVRKWNDWEADAVFIDNTGGFGASWIDNLLRLGKSPIGIHFSQESGDPQYFNKRTEMAFKCIEWIKRGGALPDCMELSQALTQTTYTFKGEKLLLEPKEEIKKKLGFSPDHMDALCLTFALPVDAERAYGVVLKNQGHTYDYDPLARERIIA
jgi:phage terminase large subunit